MNLLYKKLQMMNKGNNKIEYITDSKKKYMEIYAFLSVHLWTKLIYWALHVYKIQLVASCHSLNIPY